MYTWTYTAFINLYFKCYYILYLLIYIKYIYILYIIYYIIYLIYIILHITYPLYLHILRDITQCHSREITWSYSQNLAYLLSGNRCDIKHQGKTSDYVLSPGQRNLSLDIQTTIIISEMIMPKNTART